MVPVSHGAEDAASARNRLHRAAVVGRMVVSHAVAIDQIDSSFFAGDDSQVRMRSRLVRQQHRASRTQIIVIGVELVDVEGREVVVELQTLPSQAEQAVAVIAAILGGVEASIPGREKYTAVFVCGWPRGARPE